MDNPLIPENQDAVIEDALQTYPLADLPHDLTPAVMARLRSAPAPQAFRLTWKDLALSFLLSLCMGAIWFGLDHVPPMAVALLRKESILFYQHLLVNARWLIPVVSFSLAAFLFVLTVPYLKRELTGKSA